MIRPHTTQRIHWQGIEIEIRYCKAWISSDVNGYNIAHLEIEAIEPKRARLPMTETGYRSHFCQHADIMEHGGAAGFVKAWLEHEAEAKEWKAYVEASKQPDMFDLL